ncbi:YggT family protein [Paenibacillus sp. SYP-B3998]|uniref:YggT family protein n=2 Tax=Paenibacillus sp. SYP-B3998 TaxID=2678564 RepID=A0A6G3ZTC1_9BACL|nr:YggT family protein [Paenibacillus sp. SYP-B3998]NEW05288.1 YggT family protein [Paenibacillus sp. SYP-B3998]
MEIYYFMIIGYLVLSWFPNARDSFIGGLLAKLVEPYLRPFRKIIPSIGPIDLSPIVALIALRFVVLGIVAVLDFIVGVF